GESGPALQPRPSGAGRGLGEAPNRAPPRPRSPPCAGQARPPIVRGPLWGGEDMSQETMFRDAVDALRARGSRYSREAYVFGRAARGETVRALPAERLADADRRHLSGQELTAGLIGIAREEFGPLAPMVFREWGVRSTEDIGAIVFELVDAG